MGGEVKMLTDKQLKKLLKQAIKKFYDNDIILLKDIEGMERSCVFRIGIYLQELMNNHSEFDNLNLDCEYNKSNTEVKCLNEQHVIPDLIIHKRNLDNLTTNNNIMIVEFKGWWNREHKQDIEKLEAFTNSHDVYNYQLGVFISLSNSYEELKPRYFKNGKEINENEL